jgi:hypothetical protein
MDQDQAEIIERIAEALYDTDSVTYGGFYIPWKETSKHRKDNYRRLAVAALNTMQAYVDENED